jgi:hypothetical protein
MILVQFLIHYIIIFLYIFSDRLAKMQIAGFHASATGDYSISQKEFQVRIAQAKKYYCPILKRTYGIT